MIRFFLQAQAQGIEAEKRTLVIASLKLLLFIFLISFSLSEILLLMGDNAVYAGKEQFIAWYCCLFVFSLGMIVDASYVLVKNKQSAVAGKLRGIVGTLLAMFVLILSPLRFLGLVITAAAMGMLWTAISLLIVIL
jgi:hypothetical protein